MYRQLYCILASIQKNILKGHASYGHQLRNNYSTVYTMLYHSIINSEEAEKIAKNSHDSK